MPPRPSQRTRRVAAGAVGEPSRSAAVPSGAVTGTPRGATTSNSGKCTSRCPRSVAGVEDALVGERAGAGRAGRGRPGRTQPGVAADLLGHLVHLLAGLQEALGVAAVEVAQVHRHQPPGRVEHVDRRGVEPVGEADRVGEHDREPGPRPERARPAIRAACGEEPGPDPGSRWETTSTTSCSGPTRSSQRASTSRPRSSRRSVAARPSSEAGPSSTRTSPRAGDVLGDQLGRAHRGAALPGGVGRRDQPAHRRPAAAAAGQEGHPGQPGVAGGAAAGGVRGSGRLRRPGRSHAE